MPPKKNPQPSQTLRKRCKGYLTETPHSEWNFTDFWDGDEDLRSRCGDVWLRALQDIINTTDDESKILAATTTTNKYKQREHLPRSTRYRTKAGGLVKRNTTQERYPSETPPSYVLSSQEQPIDAKSQTTLHAQQFHTLSADQKWHLPGGRTVEDVLFGWVVSQSDAARRLNQKPKESSAHSYILDIDNPKVKELFNGPGEWDEIASRLLPIPTIDTSFESFMYAFASAKTAAELRQLLMSTPYVPPGETYSCEKHGDQAWIHSLLSSLVVLYEHDHVRTDNLETWFQINIWGPIFDRCFQYIPKMSVIRAESQSPSNSDRKNVDPTARKPIGSKYDGLIVHNRIEYGAVEDSKKLDDKKWTTDSLKLAKLLHDQMRRLERKVMHDKDALGGFRCLGFLTAGLQCRAMYLQYGKGHVCLLKRGPQYEVPEDVHPLCTLIAVVSDVWRMREVVRMSISNLAKFHDNTTVLFRAAVTQGEVIPAILPTCLDTDAGF